MKKEDSIMYAYAYNVLQKNNFFQVILNMNNKFNFFRLFTGMNFLKFKIIKNPLIYRDISQRKDVKNLLK